MSSSQSHDLNSASSPVIASVLQVEHDLNCSSVPLPSPKVGRSSQSGAAVRRSISMSRHSSRDSSGRSTMSPDITRTINYFNCHFLSLLSQFVNCSSWILSYL